MRDWKAYQLSFWIAGLSGVAIGAATSLANGTPIWAIIAGVSIALNILVAIHQAFKWIWFRKAQP